MEKMRFNTLSSVLLCVVLGALFVSCGQRSKYDDAIEDCVKYYVATDNYISNQGDKLYIEYLTSMTDGETLYDFVKGFHDEVNYLCHNRDHYTYRNALSTIIEDGTSRYLSLAYDVRNQYDSVEVVLTDFAQVASSRRRESWTFKEQRSGQYFYFDLDGIHTDTVHWICHPIQPVRHK